MSARFSVASSFLIAFAVVTLLHAQDRRANTPAPAQRPGQAGMYAQLMHVRFTSPVMAPGGPPNGGTSEVRARLETPVLSSAPGSTERTVVIPAGVDVNIELRLSTCCNARPVNSRLYMRIVSANVDPAEGRRRFGSAEVTHDFLGWPKPDEAIIPQNATVSFPLIGTAPDAATVSAAEKFASRPILQSSRLFVALLDEPITVNNAGADKLFRAQLTQDMTFQEGQVALPAGAIKLAKGTEVYVRSYEPDPEAQLGHGANWSVDFVVINGKRIPIRTTVVRMPFQPGALAISPDGKSRIPMVLWPVGQVHQFLLSEEQEVADSGTTLWIYPAHPNSAEDYRMPPGSPQGPVPQQSTANPPAPQPTQTTSGDDARKRADALRACQQQAIAANGRNPVALARALAACNQAK